MNTIKSIVEKVSKLDQTQGLVSVFRSEAALDAALKIEMAPVEEFRTNNWRRFIDAVHVLLRPVYDKASELKHVGQTALDIFEQHVQLVVNQLAAEGVTIELSSSDNGIVIKNPKNIGQYVRITRAMLKYDAEGVALKLDNDGDPMYVGKSAVEQLGKNLKAAYDAAQAEARRAAAKAAGVLVDLTPKGADTNSSSNEKSKDGSVPPAIVTPTGAVSSEPAPEPTVIDLALASLAEVFKQAGAVAHMQTLNGDTVEDWIVGKCAELEKKVTNLLTHNLRGKAGDALDKAAAKVA